MSCKYVLRYIIIGDTGVGKSCILKRFSDNEFTNKYEVTVGVEFATKIGVVNGVPIKFQIWDTAGQETFKSITRSYYKSACGAFLVYDIGKRSSFDSLSTWLEELKNLAHRDISIILVGNKSDTIEGERKVSYEEGKAFADSHKLLFAETSAKTSDMIEHCF